MNISNNKTEPNGDFGMYLRMKILMIAIAICFSVLPISACKAEQQKNTDSEWTLPPLTKEERFEKINEFILNNSFSLYEGAVVKSPYDADEKKYCEDVLGFIKKIADEDILVPEHVSQSETDSWIEERFGNCLAEIEIYRDYKPSKNAWYDKNDTAHEASMYFSPTKNMEFYNLTSLLEGKERWAVFAEGGIPHCQKPDSNDCLNWAGFTSMAKIFDPNECRIISDLGLNVGRLKPHVISSKTGRTITYHPTNDFFALVKANNTLYQLTFKTDLISEEYCPRTSCPMTSAGTYLHINEIQTLSQPHTKCVYRLN